MPEYQWKAQLTGLAKDTAYCYRIVGGGWGSSARGRRRPSAPRCRRVDDSVLVRGASVTGARSDRPARTSTSSNLIGQIASSGARFAVRPATRPIPAGGSRTTAISSRPGPHSAIFGPSFWAQAGASMPLFNPGTTGSRSTRSRTGRRTRPPRLERTLPDRHLLLSERHSLGELPERLVRVRRRARALLRAGRRVGQLNVGTGTLYGNDFDSHWTVDSAEYQWLRAGPGGTPQAHVVRVLPLPVVLGQRDRGGRPVPQRPGQPRRTAGRYGVDIVFNGHAHIYERNTPRPRACRSAT